MGLWVSLPSFQEAQGQRNTPSSTRWLQHIHIMEPAAGHEPRSHPDIDSPSNRETKGSFKCEAIKGIAGRETSINAVFMARCKRAKGSNTFFETIGN